MIKYELYLLETDAPITSFESSWQYSPKEIVFIHDFRKKRNFEIKHITHDIHKNYGHVVRLYCQEKKVFEN